MSSSHFLCLIMKNNQKAFIKIWSSPIHLFIKQSWSFSMNSSCLQPCPNFPRCWRSVLLLTDCKWLLKEVCHKELPHVLWLHSSGCYFLLQNPLVLPNPVRLSAEVCEVIFFQDAPVSIISLTHRPWTVTASEDAGILSLLYLPRKQSVKVATWDRS